MQLENGLINRDEERQSERYSTKDCNPSKDTQTLKEKDRGTILL
jgi:hypothetical protein